MPKIHHDFTVGMMAVTGDNTWKVGGQGSSATSLKQELDNIYLGDRISPYQACNHVQSYGDDFGWTLQSANTVEPFYGRAVITQNPPVANPPVTDAERHARVDKNVAAWVNYLRVGH